jgi:molybdate transport system substrate-binding protein
MFKDLHLPLYFAVYNRSPRSNRGQAMTRSRLWSAIAAAAVVLQGLAATPAPAAEVMVFAAASTSSAVEEVMGLYERDGGARVRASFAASSTLAKQIANGAPADIYLSASPAWMDYLDAKALIDTASRREVFGNRLALIVPSDSALAAQSSPESALANALGDGRLAIGDPDHVPAGGYAKAALESLGLWRDLAGRLARAPDVRAALAWVERGETPAGIVYATDAAITDRVRIVSLFPRDSHPPIVYPIALVKDRGRPEVEAFLAFLCGSPGRAVFARHGFTIAGPAGQPAAR